MRIKYRWKALDAENDAIDQARKQAYNLSLNLSNIFEKTTDKLYGLARMLDGMRQQDNRALNPSSRFPDPFSTIIKPA